MVLCCGLKLAPRCVGSGNPCEGFPWRSSSATACDQLGLPSKSYKVICGLSLPVLGLAAFGRGHTVNQGPLPPVLAWGGPAKGPKQPEADTTCPLPVRSSH